MKVLIWGRGGRGADAGSGAESGVVDGAVRTSMKSFRAETERSFPTGPSFAISFSKGGTLAYVTGFRCGRCSVRNRRPW